MCAIGLTPGSMFYWQQWREKYTTRKCITTQFLLVDDFIWTNENENCKVMTFAVQWRCVEHVLKLTELKLSSPQGIIICALTEWEGWQLTITMPSLYRQMPSTVVKDARDWWMASLPLVSVRHPQPLLCPPRRPSPRSHSLMLCKVTSTHIHYTKMQWMLIDGPHNWTLHPLSRVPLNRWVPASLLPPEGEAV
jgi:hypothetical protein